jgi:glycogen operon protein
MIVMGDEVRRTQCGNNNAYCQDNELSWLDWSELHRHADVLRFAKLLIARRLMREVGCERRRVSLNQLLRVSTHAWHGVKLGQPDWNPSSHSVALYAKLPHQELHLHLILNAYWEALNFELPVLSGAAHPWRRWIDTGLEPPNDIVEWRRAPEISGRTYQTGPRSVVALVAGSGFEEDTWPSDGCDFETQQER